MTKQNEVAEGTTKLIASLQTRLRAERARHSKANRTIFLASVEEYQRVSQPVSPGLPCEQRENETCSEMLARQEASMDELVHQSA